MRPEKTSQAVLKWSVAATFIGKEMGLHHFLREVLVPSMDQLNVTAPSPNT